MRAYIITPKAIEKYWTIDEMAEKLDAFIISKDNLLVFHNILNVPALMLTMAQSSADEWISILFDKNFKSAEDAKDAAMLLEDMGYEIVIEDD